MSGIRSGVQALVKSQENRALYVHCFAHSLNLCVHEVSKQIDLVRNVMDLVYNLVQLIKFSPKRATMFERFRMEISINSGQISGPSLRTLCPTRWTVRHTSIESILRNYKVLLDTLEEVEKVRDEYAAKAHGMIMQMEMFDTFFGLKLAHFIFAAAEQFSTNLQSKDITIQEAIRGSELLISHLKSHRTEPMFDLYDKIIMQVSNLTEPPKLPRYRKVPKRLDGGEHPHCYHDPKIGIAIFIMKH